MSTKSTITVARCNTYQGTLSPRIKSGSTITPYTLANGEKITFTIKATEDKEAEIMLQKVYTSADYDANNKIPIKLTPSETDLSPATYYFAFALQRPAVPEDDFSDIANGQFVIVRTASEEEEANEQ
jgi:hypothetical protein